MGLDSRELTFEEESHTYRLDGEIIPSVSQIIDAAGYWGEKKGSFAPGAAEKGRRIHQAIELLNLKQLDWKQIEGTGYEPYLRGYEMWRTDWRPEIREIECRLVGECHGVVYAGTVDLIADVRGALQILDVKTGRQYPKPYRAQLGGYMIAYQQERERKVDGLAGLHVNDKGRYQLKRYKPNEAEASFEYACGIWKMMQEEKKSDVA